MDTTPTMELNHNDSLEDIANQFAQVGGRGGYSPIDDDDDTDEKNGRSSDFSHDDNDNSSQVMEERQKHYRNLLTSLRKWVFRPFLIGAAGAFGMSFGYALFDRVSQNWFFRLFLGSSR